VGANGKRRPPRPRIEMVSAGASEVETAAIVAALQRFLEDHAPRPEPPRDRPSPWLRAGLQEAMAARHAGAYAWGQPPR